MGVVFGHKSIRMVSSPSRWLKKNMLLLPLTTDEGSKSPQPPPPAPNTGQSRSPACASTQMTEKPFPLIFHILKGMKTEAVNVTQVSWSKRSTFLSVLVEQSLAQVTDVLILSPAQAVTLSQFPARKPSQTKPRSF